MRRSSQRSRPGGDWFAPALPRLLAHRGLAINTPENTIESFASAMNVGACYLETDVHASKDGVAMLSHDPVLDRVAGVRGDVESLTVSELKLLDLGGGHRMPTLEEALDAFPRARFNIDVKSPRAAPAIAKAVLDAGATHRVLITSFSSRRRAHAVRLIPGVASSASSPRVIVLLALAQLGILHRVPLAARGIQAVQVPARTRHFEIATPRLIRAFHRVGLEMHVWTVNEPAEMARLLALGVDGLVSDRVDYALDLLRQG